MMQCDRLEWMFIFVDSIERLCSINFDTSKMSAIDWIICSCWPTIVFIFVSIFNGFWVKMSVIESVQLSSIAFTVRQWLGTPSKNYKIINAALENCPNVSGI